MSRSCARPGCDQPAVATMSFDYAQRSVWIDALERVHHPSNYDLCAACAEKMTPPRGWVLTDQRSRTLFEAVS